MSDPIATSNKNKKIIVTGMLVALAAIIGWICFNVIIKATEFSASDKILPTDSISRLWYKSAVIYALDVKVFKDSDGDGVGDFIGLTQKLDYIDSLGANVIWLAPFQPSPGLDDGYDITDYTGIDKRLGTRDDFKAFITAARKHKIRVIMNLVLNHTSIEHTWFKQARQSALSSYKNWYTWSKERPKNYNTGMAYPGVQKDTWTYDSVAKEYYYHRYYNFQPDLNMLYPAVQREIEKIFKYWIDMGLNGFSLNAIPYLIEVPKTTGEKFEHRFEVLTQLRSYIQGLRDDAIIVGEANVLPKDIKPYFGVNGNAMQMMYNLYVNQYLFYALASGEVKTLKLALEATNNIPATAEWLQLLRNNEELDLGRLSRRQRNEVYDKFGKEKNMQLYGRGIRRRLAPMMNNNRKLIELAYSTLFSLPGTPVIRYGEEIGMGDNLALKDRESVRTPMQWSADTAGNFTPTGKAIIPVIDSGSYGYKNINVDKQTKQSNSLLNWTRLIIKVHKQCPEISFGSRKILETDNSHLLVIRYEWQGTKLLVIHNFSKESQKLSLNKKDSGGSILKNLFSSGENLKTGKKNIHVGLEGYGYRWYKVQP